MGVSTNGILAYGIDIGDDSPPVAGLDEYEDWRPPGFTTDSDSDEYYAFNFRNWAERKLLAAAGHPVGDDEYYDPDDVKRDWGVWFKAHGWGEEPQFMLVAHEESASWGDPEDIDFAELERRRVEENWDDKLAAVLKVLGLEDDLYYPQERYQGNRRIQKPRWILTAYRG